MDGTQTIGQFLEELSADQERLEAYFENPEAVVRESRLSEEDQELVLSGDLNRIGEALNKELGTEEFLQRGPVKAIIPWPIWPVRKPVTKPE